MKRFLGLTLILTLLLLFCGCMIRQDTAPDAGRTQETEQPAETETGAEPAGSGSENKPAAEGTEEETEPPETGPEEIPAEESETAESEPPESDAEPGIEIGEDESWKLILVNADHPLPEDFRVSLKALRNGHHVDERIYPELQEMFDDARAEGIYPLINESFRTAERQQEIMDKYIARYEAEGLKRADAEKKAREIVAIPGTSEHQLGLALDIIAEKGESADVWKWLKDNSWRYGFILRYPNGTAEITGIRYEPWHYRYVGRGPAEEIHRMGITLEEYLLAREGR
jgi:D-alanyl-D-alanine carboxypeptidase